MKTLTRPGRKPKVSARHARKLVRAATMYHHGDKGTRILRQTLRRTLNRAGLNGCRPQKTPPLKPNRTRSRVDIAKGHLDEEEGFWLPIIWSDEMKMELFGHRDVAYVCRRKGEVFNPKNWVPNVKHGGGSVVL